MFVHFIFATVEHALSRYALETYDGAFKLEIYLSDKSFTKFCIILFSTATMIEIELCWLKYYRKSDWLITYNRIME